MPEAWQAVALFVIEDGKPLLVNYVWTVYTRRSLVRECAVARRRQADRRSAAPRIHGSATGASDKDN
jgi:heme exporter protein D